MFEVFILVILFGGGLGPPRLAMPEVFTLFFGSGRVGSGVIVSSPDLELMLLFSASMRLRFTLN